MHFAVPLKLIQHYKSTILPNKKKALKKCFQSASHWPLSWFRLLYVFTVRAFSLKNEVPPGVIQPNSEHPRGSAWILKTAVQFSARATYVLALLVRTSKIRGT